MVFDDKDPLMFDFEKIYACLAVRSSLAIGPDFRPVPRTPLNLQLILYRLFHNLSSLCLNAPE